MVPQPELLNTVPDWVRNLEFLFGLCSAYNIELIPLIGIFLAARNTFEFHHLPIIVSDGGRNR